MNPSGRPAPPVLNLVGFAVIWIALFVTGYLCSFLAGWTLVGTENVEQQPGYPVYSVIYIGFYVVMVAIMLAGIVLFIMRRSWRQVLIVTGAIFGTWLLVAAVATMTSPNFWGG